MDSVEDPTDSAEDPTDSAEDCIDSAEDSTDSAEDVDGLKQRARETNTMLKSLREQYIQRANAAQQQNAPLSSKYEKVKSALAKNPLDKALEKAEKNMRRHQMAIFTRN